MLSLQLRCLLLYSIILLMQLLFYCIAGVVGSTGAAGGVGATGATGAVGATGAKGAVGATGAKGM